MPDVTPPPEVAAHAGELRIDYVPIAALKVDPENPKDHDLGAITESFKAFGFVAPMVVNETTGFLAAGHGRLETLLRMHGDGAPPPDRIKVKKGQWYAPVVRGIAFPDDATAQGYLIADNRLVQLGGWRDRELATLLAKLAKQEKLIGVGYDRDDVDALLRQVASDSATTIDAVLASAPSHGLPLMGLPPPEGSVQAALAEAQGTHRAGVLRPPDPTTDTTIKTLDDVSSRLPGITELREDVTFPIETPHGIPMLRTDRLMTDVPQPLATWASREFTPDDQLSHYVFVYSQASAVGLPWDRTILAFFVFDDQFENWWHMPAFYTAKLVNAGLHYAIPPDFSIWEKDPKALQLFNCYRTQWMGRYFQEAGLTVLPRVDWGSIASLEYTLEGIPSPCPALAVNLQTMDAKIAHQVQNRKDGIRIVLDRLKPETIVCYSGNPGWALMQSLDLPCRTVYAKSYWTVRNEHGGVKNRALLGGDSAEGTDQQRVVAKATRGPRTLTSADEPTAPPQRRTAKPASSSPSRRRKATPAAPPPAPADGSPDGGST